MTKRRAGKYRKVMWALLIGRGCVTYSRKADAVRSQDCYFTKAPVVRVIVQEIKAGRK
jgi:hypothetical protein